MAEAPSKNSLSEKLECPVCLDYYEIPIRQCVKGHSFCNKCISPNNKKCPICRSDIAETRNYILEEIIESMPLSCNYKDDGCKYMLTKELMQLHITECKYRTKKCEGAFFCGWKCDWTGQDILAHFKKNHPEHRTMEFATTATVPYNSKQKFSDIQLIPAHFQLFWYKHKIDITKNKAFWAFQLIGLKKQAPHYYYEFELFKNSDPIRKFKITEFCESDQTDVNEIFESEKCVAISLTALKSYQDENGEFSFRFRIMKIKKVDDKSKGAVKNKVESDGKTSPGEKFSDWFEPQRQMPQNKPPVKNVSNNSNQIPKYAEIRRTSGQPLLPPPFFPIYPNFGYIPSSMMPPPPAVITPTTDRHQDKNNQNGFRNAQNVYYHQNFEGEFFRDYITSFTFVFGGSRTHTNKKPVSATKKRSK